MLKYGIKDEYRNYIWMAKYATGYPGFNYGMADDFRKALFYNERGGKYGQNLTLYLNIGLMDASDYLYANSNHSSEPNSSYNYFEPSMFNNSQNWLYIGNEWLGNAETVLPIKYAELYLGNYYYDYEGYYRILAGNAYIRPTFYLYPNVIITSGDGSYDNPYQLSMNEY